MDILEMRYSRSWSYEAKNVIADIDLRGWPQDYDIHRAVRTVWGEDRLKLIDVLCEVYKCDIHHQDKFGNTVIHAQVASLPNAYGYNNEGLLEDLDYLKRLIKKVDIKTKNNYGNTVFHDLMFRGDRLIVEGMVEKYSVNVVKFLLGLMPNFTSSVNIDGNTLLHLAVAFGHPKTTKFLLESKTSVGHINKTNHDKLTPLHYAVLGNHQDYVDVAKLLLEDQDKIDVKHLKTAFNMANDLIIKGKATIVTAEIITMLHKKIKTLDKDKTARGSQENCPQLDQIYCTVSPDYYAPPQYWIPGVVPKRREVYCASQNNTGNIMDKITDTARSFYPR